MKGDPWTQSIDLVHGGGPLPDFIQWGPEYESVYYGIHNTKPIYSERVHQALQNP